MHSPIFCPWCASAVVLLRIGALEVCPVCRMTVASNEEGAERSAQLPETLGGCGRCRGLSAQAEVCWFCLGDLCAACWDAYGHCGHAEAEAFNERARAWKPGDPLLEAPWRLKETTA